MYDCVCLCMRVFVCIGICELETFRDIFNHAEVASNGDVYV